jgi:short-subunit dehydrogenase
MANTALISGASSGIGWELAKYHASKGGDLIITARRDDKLNNLKAEIEKNYDVKVKIIPLDLSVQGGAAALYKKVKATGKTIDILINNAGFGGHGFHIERELEQEEKMIELNVKTVVSLTHMIGNDMVKSGKGKMLHVSSTAGFSPGPLQAVYFATKAF